MLIYTSRSTWAHNQVKSGAKSLKLSAESEQQKERRKPLNFKVVTIINPIPFITYCFGANKIVLVLGVEKPGF